MAKTLEHKNTGTDGKSNSSYRLLVSKCEESFLFQRNTDGLSWLNEFESFQDYKTFSYMVMLENNKTGIIIFTLAQIKDCANVFKVSVRTIRRSITALISIKAVKRLSNGNYKANPKYLYQGGVASYFKKESEWNPKPSSEIPTNNNY